MGTSMVASQLPLRVQSTICMVSPDLESEPYPGIEQSSLTRTPHSWLKSWFPKKLLAIEPA